MADEITLGDLLPQMEAQATRMSMKNPARRVLWIAAQVLIAQAKALHEYREQAQAAPRVVLTGSAEAESDTRSAID